VDPGFDPGSGVQGFITSLALQSDGHVILGGRFNSVGGVAKNNLARLDSSGIADPNFPQGFGANSGGVSNVVVLPDDRILVCGTSINGDYQRAIGRLNADGSVDISFNPYATGASTEFDQLVGVQSDGRIVVGGANRFAYGITRLTAEGSNDLSYAGYWVTSPGGVAGFGEMSFKGGIQPDGKALVLTDGALGLRLLANGTRDFSFAGANKVAACAFQPDGKILVAGTFTNIGGGDRPRLARLNSDGSLDISFDPGMGPDSPPEALAVQPDGRILVCGNFTNLNGITRMRIARLNADGSVDESFDPGAGADGEVSAMALTKDGGIVIGGQFANVGGVPRGRIARLKGDDPEVPALASGPAVVDTQAGRSVVLWARVSGAVPAQYQWQFHGTNIPSATNGFLEFSSVRLADAGEYVLQTTNAQGSLVCTGAVLTVQRAPVHPGSPDAVTFNFPRVDSVVNAVCARPNGKVLIGGIFTRVNGTDRNHIAQLNADGSLDFGFDPGLGPNDTVHALALQDDGKLLIGGAFTNVNGFICDHIARLNTNGAVDTTFRMKSGSNSSVAVYALAIQTGGAIFAGGNFWGLNGGSGSDLAFLDSSGWPHSSFSGVEGIVYTLLPTGNGGVFAGGSTYTGAGHLEHCSINDASENSSYSATLPAGSAVRSLAQLPDGRLLVGGSFSGGLIRISPNHTRDTNFNPGWPAGSYAVNSLMLLPDGKIVAGGNFKGNQELKWRHLVRLNPDGKADGRFDPDLDADGEVFALAALPNGKTLAGGAFSSTDGCRGAIALLNGDLRIEGRWTGLDGFHVMVQTDLGKNYSLEFNDSPGNGGWTPLPVFEGDGLIRDLLDTGASPPRRFYRVRVE
jgi:uncharacterized delta-60 repeat protein